MRKAMTLFLPVMALLPAAVFAQKMTTAELLGMAKEDAQSAKFHAAVAATLGEGEINKGTAVAGIGPEFVWAVAADAQPALFIDDEPAQDVRRVRAPSFWIFTGRMKTGTSHSFHYLVNGRRFGGRNDVAAYLPECYAQTGVPQGALSEKLLHTSKIYDGMISEWWIYVPAQYDAARPAAVMVWQDGQGNIQRDGGSRTMNVVDNLINQKKIPVMIQVFIAPGTRGAERLRSIQYDTVNDRYGRFLRDEILAEVASRYNIRRDGYSRAIAGNSSGGICAFNVAWHMTDQFSRVLSRIGSFTSIQWRPGEIDGGNVYPFKVRKEPKRNIRVWLQDGSEDLENNHGSWPLQNIQLANSLKMRGYDFHLSWGNGTHNGAHGNAELPEAMTWLWRDYDPAQTEQNFEQEASEQARPMFRVKITNR